MKARNSCISRINTIIRWCYADNWSHDKLLEKIQEFYNSKEFSKLTGYNRSYIWGYLDARYPDFNRDMEFKYLWKDNNWYTTKELESLFADFTHYELTMWIKECDSNNVDCKGFFWKGKPDRRYS